MVPVQLLTYGGNVPVGLRSNPNSPTKRDQGFIFPLLWMWVLNPDVGLNFLWGMPTVQFPSFVILC